MEATFFDLVAIGTVSMALAIGVSGCSPEGNKVTMVDKDGKQTVVKGPLNAGVTNFRGDFRATVRVRFPDGSPAANLPYRLGYLSASPNTVVATGILSPDGVANIDGLAAGDPPVFYDVEVDSQLLGTAPLGLDRNSNQFEFLLPAKVGMKVPALALRYLDTGERLQLTDLRGQIVLVDFYTTTCAPCQPALKNLNELLERRADSWRGNVTVLAIGLDAVAQPGVSVETVAKHVRRKGWNRIRPVVPDYDFSSEPAKRFPLGVNGVPHAFLISPDGLILWSGTASNAELEQKIERLLQVGGGLSGPTNGSLRIPTQTNSTPSATGSPR